MQLRDELLRLFPGLRSMPRDAVVVGGAVRDLILGGDPRDVDVDCADPLAAAQSLGRKVIRLGRGDFIAWRVVEHDRVYDFAPASSLGRRDFTINAMAVDLGTGDLLDPFGGEADIRTRTVRMVDGKNFDDDPLRLLRAVRFAVALDFSIDPTTLDAIRARAPQIANVAAERVEYELSVIFSSGAFRRAVELLRATNLDLPLLGVALEPSRFHADDVPLAATYALLLRDPRAFAARWRVGESLVRDVVALQRLAREHDRIALYDAGERVARQLPSLLRAAGRDDRLDMPDFSIRALLTGDEIAAITGLPPGPRLGAIKRALLEAQIRGEVRTREDAERLVSSQT